MENYICKGFNCDFEADPDSSFDIEQCESIRETGLCLECREDVAYCPKHDGYCFEHEDIESIKECEMCKECAQDWLGEPETDDSDFWDSYDPD
jgi:hypothetical protein